ncbi:MAG: FAD-dependent oxidoreductase [Erythrobacter sp.]
MTKRIVLAGGGHAHLAVLADWLSHPSANEDRALVTPAERSAYSGMLPGWMAGIYPEAEIFIPVAKLARKAGARVILASVEGLDADRRSLKLSGGEELDFDLLSLATGGQVHAAGFLPAPQSSQTGDVLSVRPVETFVQQWQEFVERVPEIDCPSATIIGGGAGGVELAMAAAARMKSLGQKCEIALVTPEEGFLDGHSAKVRDLARKALSDRGITIHWAKAHSKAGGLALDNGTQLSPDVTILATGSRPQGWLSQSGLECNSDGYVRVGPTMQSASHPSIFAAGDIVERTDRYLERSGVHAVKAGPILASNLRAMMADGALKTYDAREKTLYLLSTSDRNAILSRGGFATMGRSAWWLKDWIDRGFVSRYRHMAG